MCLFLIRNVLDLFLLFCFFWENFYFIVLFIMSAARFWKYIHCKKMFGGE